MFTLGFSEFIRNIKKNILVIIQMIGVYVIVIFTMSAFVEQYRLIDGISEVFDDTGMIMFKSALGEDTFVNEDVLKEILIKVEDIEHTLSVSLYDEYFEMNSHGMESISLSACNPEYITYVPELIEGQWCEDVEREKGIINVVVSNNLPFSIEIGETIEYAGYQFKITGIVSTKEMIYGIGSSYGYDTASYLDYYKSMEEMGDEEEYLFLASYDDMIDELSIDPSNSMLWGTFTTVDYEDDITQEEYEHNLKTLEDAYGHDLNTDVFYTKGVYEYSWQLIDLKVMPMVMLLIVIVIALVVSLIISGAINILYEKKNYGIYFICGNNWKNTFKFSFVSWAIMAVSSLILAGCGCVIAISMNISLGLSLSFTWLHVGALLAVTVMLLLITVLIPFIMLRKIQPVSILKENDK